MEELLKEKHKRIDDCLDLHTNRLNDHSRRLKEVERCQATTEVKLDNVINQIKELNTTIKWAATFIISTFVAFFVWYVKGGF